MKRLRKAFKSLLAALIKNEKHLSTAVFLGGFLLDNLALRRVDEPWVNSLFLGYLTAAGLAIAIAHRVMPDTEAAQKRSVRTLIPLVAQFAIGALLSGCFVFYARSATLYTSWPFLLLLGAVFVGNEVLRKYRERLAFQSILFFFALYTYAIFALPIAKGAMGTLIFFESGALSVLLFGLFLSLLLVINKKRLLPSLRRIVSISGGLFLAMNLFYITGILPPLPLSLQDIGVYHQVTRMGDGSYQVTGEEAPFSLFGAQTIHLRAGDSVYAYSAVFAPVALTTPVVHHWEFFDTATSAWVTKAKITFPISGGREEGYRGYSTLANPAPGLWRVSVETQSGAVIGRLRFGVETASTEPALRTETK